MTFLYLDLQNLEKINSKISCCCLLSEKWKWLYWYQLKISFWYFFPIQGLWGGMMCGILLQTLLLLLILYKTNWKKEVCNTYSSAEKWYCFTFHIWMNFETLNPFIRLTLINCRWKKQMLACRYGVDNKLRLIKLLLQHNLTQLFCFFICS